LRIIEVTHLGFPAYFRVELSWAKLLGVVLLLAPVPARLKEWSYAGFVSASLDDPDGPVEEGADPLGLRDRVLLTGRKDRPRRPPPDTVHEGQPRERLSLRRHDRLWIGAPLRGGIPRIPSASAQRQEAARMDLLMALLLSNSAECVTKSPPLAGAERYNPSALLTCHGAGPETSMHKLDMVPRRVPVSSSPARSFGAAAGEGRIAASGG
jgi:DoxX-like protein